MFANAQRTVSIGRQSSSRPISSPPDIAESFAEPRQSTWRSGQATLRCDTCHALGDAELRPRPVDRLEFDRGGRARHRGEGGGPHASRGLSHKDARNRPDPCRRARALLRG